MLLVSTLILIHLPSSLALLDRCASSQRDNTNCAHELSGSSMSQAPRRKKAKLADAATPSSSSAQHSTPGAKPLFVAVYNFKGGCGKTFIVRELAAAAVKAGKRAGMVDLDPQCNLTSWWLPGGKPYQGVGTDVAAPPESDSQGETSGNETDESEDVEERVAAAGSAEAPRVLQYPLHEHTDPLGIQDYRSDNLPNNLHFMMEAAMLDPKEFMTAKMDLEEIPSPGDGGLWLLPGSRQVLQLEPLLNVALTDASGMLSRYIGAFHAVLMRMSTQANLDIIFVDCSPSCGALNKVAVMSCDYILPPAMVDPSNLSSLHGLLTAVLPTWYHDHHALRERTRKATARMSEGGAIYCLPKKPPRVLPTVAINFGLRDSKVMKNKSQWIRQIRTLYADIIHQSSQPLPADHEYIEQLQHEGLNKVVNSLQPERQGLETHYVWAMVCALEAPLFTAAKNRWPASWSVHPDDIAYFRSEAVLRDQRYLIKSHDKKAFAEVLRRLLSLVNWIMSHQNVG